MLPQLDAWLVVPQLYFEWVELVAANVFIVLVDWDDVAGISVRVGEVLAPRDHHKVAEDVDGTTVLLVGVQISEWPRVLLACFKVAHLGVGVNEGQIVGAVPDRVVELVLPAAAQVGGEGHVREASNDDVLVGGGASRVVHTLLALDEHEYV